MKKILLYEMKFLVPNYSCLQDPWLGGYRPHIPVLSVLCPQLNLLNPRNKIPGYATSWSNFLPRIVTQNNFEGDTSLLRCDAVTSGEYLPTFREIVLRSSAGSINSSRSVFVSICPAYQSTDIIQNVGNCSASDTASHRVDVNLQQRRYENLLSSKVTLFRWMCLQSSTSIQFSNFRCNIGIWFFLCLCDRASLIQ